MIHSGSTIILKSIMMMYYVGKIVDLVEMQLVSIWRYIYELFITLFITKDIKNDWFYLMASNSLFLISGWNG